MPKVFGSDTLEIPVKLGTFNDSPIILALCINRFARKIIIASTFEHFENAFPPLYRIKYPLSQELEQ